ncbi:Cyclic nucleotide-binding protein [Pseudocohnilembus persalinus]|uniref:Cyclic nucleotide-binding protein n=1 Tax=Pseudocohnilembus persalinus TaxID=266149 RepID=A0A0V0QTP6_PSEPJ|nr:Cyclic nucleotide-binding protein [Pseudocohnilembus persalinus]|eukprot:KRX05630.1 Cyclic nucleotide-binding protein [Pseudocohnilembus persalinus]
MLNVPPKERTSASIKNFLNEIKEIPFFKNLYNNGLQEIARQIVKNLIHTGFNKDAYLIQPHVPMNGLYILMSGEVGIFEEVEGKEMLQNVDVLQIQGQIIGSLDQENKFSQYTFICLTQCHFAYLSQRYQRTILQPYDIFGQENLFKKVPKEYTIICDTYDAEILVVPCQYFKSFIVQNPISKKILINKIDIAQKNQFIQYPKTQSIQPSNLALYSQFRVQDPFLLQELQKTKNQDDFVKKKQLNTSENNQKIQINQNKQANKNDFKDMNISQVTQKNNLNDLNNDLIQIPSQNDKQLSNSRLSFKNKNKILKREKNILKNIDLDINNQEPLFDPRDALLQQLYLSSNTGKHNSSKFVSSQQGQDQQQNFKKQNESQQYQDKDEEEQYYQDEGNDLESQDINQELIISENFSDQKDSQKQNDQNQQSQVQKNQYESNDDSFKYDSKEFKNDEDQIQKDSQQDFIQEKCKNDDQIQDQSNSIQQKDEIYDQNIQISDSIQQQKEQVYQSIQEDDLKNYNNIMYEQSDIKDNEQNNQEYMNNQNEVNENENNNEQQQMQNYNYLYHMVQEEQIQQQLYESNIVNLQIQKNQTLEFETQNILKWQEGLPQNFFNNLTEDKCYQIEENSKLLKWAGLYLIFNNFKAKQLTNLKVIEKLIRRLKREESDFKPEFLQFLQAESNYQQANYTFAFKKFQSVFERIQQQKQIINNQYQNVTDQDYKPLVQRIKECLTNIGKFDEAKKYENMLKSDLEIQEQQIRDKQSQEEEKQKEKIKYKQNLKHFNVLGWYEFLPEDFFNLSLQELIKNYQNDDIILSLGYFYHEYDQNNFEDSIKYLEKIQHINKNFQPQLINLLKCTTKLQLREIQEALDIGIKLYLKFQNQNVLKQNTQIYNLFYLTMASIYSELGDQMMSLNFEKKIVHEVGNEEFVYGEDNIENIKEKQKINSIKEEALKQKQILIDEEQHWQIQQNVKINLEKLDLQNENLFNWKENISPQVLIWTEEECYKQTKENYFYASLRLYMIDYENNQFESALEFIEQAIIINEKFNPWQLNFLAADCCLKENKIEQGLKYLLKSHEILLQDNQIEIQDNQVLQSKNNGKYDLLFDYLSQTYRKVGFYKRALQFYQMKQQENQMQETLEILKKEAEINSNQQEIVNINKFNEILMIKKEQ